MEPEQTDEGRRLLGLRLLHEREARGLSFRQLSARSGVSIATLVSMEKGRRLPSLLTLHGLATAYDVSVRDLLEGVYPWDGGEPPSE